MVGAPPYAAAVDVSDGVAVAALGISVIALVIAVASAKYTRDQAVESRKMRQIEAERRHQERTPEFAAEVEPVNDGAWFRLWLTLDGATPLHRIEAHLLDPEGASFTTGQDGVAAGNARPQDAVGDFPDGLLSGDRHCWRIELGKDPSAGTTVRVRVRCHGRNADGDPVAWTVLAQADVPRYGAPQVRWV